MMVRRRGRSFSSKRSRNSRRRTAFCLALCRRVNSDNAEERDDLAREIDLAVLDLQRKIAAHGFSWDEIADPLTDFLLLIFWASRPMIEFTIFAKIRRPAHQADFSGSGRLAEKRRQRLRDGAREARRASIASVADLGSLIERLQTERGARARRSRDGLADQVEVVTKRKLNGAANVIARTGDATSSTARASRPWRCWISTPRACPATSALRCDGTAAIGRLGRGAAGAERMPRG